MVLFQALLVLGFVAHTEGAFTCPGGPDEDDSVSDVSFSVNNRCFAAFDNETPISYADAAQACKDKGFYWDLATFKTQTEWNAYTLDIEVATLLDNSNLASDRQYWIGLAYSNADDEYAWTPAGDPYSLDAFSDFSQFPGSHTNPDADKCVAAVVEDNADVEYVWGDHDCAAGTIQRYICGTNDALLKCPQIVESGFNFAETASAHSGSARCSLILQADDEVSRACKDSGDACWLSEEEDFAACWTSMDDVTPCDECDDANCYKCKTTAPGQCEICKTGWAVTNANSIFTGVGVDSSGQCTPSGDGSVFVTAGEHGGWCQDQYGRNIVVGEESGDTKLQWEEMTYLSNLCEHAYDTENPCPGTPITSSSQCKAACNSYSKCQGYNHYKEDRDGKKDKKPGSRRKKVAEEYVECRLYSSDWVVEDAIYPWRFQYGAKVAMDGDSSHDGACKSRVFFYGPLIGQITRANGQKFNMSKLRETGGDRDPRDDPSDCEEACAITPACEAFELQNTSTAGTGAREKCKLYSSGTLEAGTIAGIQWVLDDTADGTVGPAMKVEVPGDYSAYAWFKSECRLFRSISSSDFPSEISCGLYILAKVEKSAEPACLSRWEEAVQLAIDDGYCPADASLDHLFEKCRPILDFVLEAQAPYFPSLFGSCEAHMGVDHSSCAHDNQRDCEADEDDGVGASCLWATDSIPTTTCDFRVCDRDLDCNGNGDPAGGSQRLHHDSSSGCECACDAGHSGLYCGQADHQDCVEVGFPACDACAQAWEVTTPQSGFGESCTYGDGAVQMCDTGCDAGEFDTPVDCVGAWGACDRWCVSHYSVSALAHKGGAECPYATGDYSFERCHPGDGECPDHCPADHVTSPEHFRLVHEGDTVFGNYYKTGYFYQATVVGVYTSTNTYDLMFDADDIWYDVEAEDMVVIPSYEIGDDVWVSSQACESSGDFETGAWEPSSCLDMLWHLGKITDGSKSSGLFSVAYKWYHLSGEYVEVQTDVNHIRPVREDGYGVHDRVWVSYGGVERWAKGDVVAKGGMMTVSYEASAASPFGDNLDFTYDVDLVLDSLQEGAGEGLASNLGATAGDCSVYSVAGDDVTGWTPGAVGAKIAGQAHDFDIVLSCSNPFIATYDVHMFSGEILTDVKASHLMLIAKGKSSSGLKGADYHAEYTEVKEELISQLRDFKDLEICETRR